MIEFNFIHYREYYIFLNFRDKTEGFLELCMIMHDYLKYFLTWQLCRDKTLNKKYKILLLYLVLRFVWCDT